MLDRKSFVPAAWHRQWVSTLTLLNDDIHSPEIVQLYRMKFQLQCCGDRAARSRAEAAETRTFRSASVLWPTFRIKKLFLLKQLSPKKINIWAIYSRAHSYMPYINFDFLPPLTRISRVLMFSLYCHSLGRVCPSRVCLWDFKKTGAEAGSDQLQYDQLELNFRMMVNKNT